MKLDNIINYSVSSQLYCFSLLKLINRDNSFEYQKEIFDKGVINSAILGYVSNIFLAIKESLVEKTENGFEAKVLNSILERNVSLIAKKTEKGYVINNYVFPDAPTLVAELRNKIAHGNFDFDLDHNRIILKINGNDVIVRINKLTMFVISSLTTYINGTYKDEYNKVIIYNDKLEPKRNKPIGNKKEIIKLINDSKKLEINLKRKDGKIIPEEIIEVIKEISTIGNQNEVNSLLYACSKIISDNYEFNWNFKKINDIDGMSIDYFSDYLVNKISDNKDYYSSVKYIIKEISNFSDKKHKMVDILANNLLNIMVLETIYETGSLNYNLIIRKMKEKTGDDIFTINQNMVVTSALSTFTSLFSYANDDVYKNNNKYTLLECDGLDYSKLDLSLIKVSKNTIDMGNINDLIDKRNAKQKEIITIKNKINKTNNDLENVRKSNNTKAIEVLSNNLGKLYVLQSKNANEYNKIVNEINVWNYYYNNSKLYLENESIISGIRNSISHGHYEISLGSSLLDTKIIFNNIYEGNVTFNASVEIVNFIKMITDNSEVVYDFIDNLKKKNMTKTLHI
mgnify:FL=1